jgi:RNA polymerase sigma-70 factor (sigma-E family)
MTFEEFLAARLPALLRYATVITCDPHLAEDVVQEVLLRAQRHWPRVRDMAAPEQYVRRMIVNEFLSWRRRRSTTSTVPFDPAALTSIASSGPGGQGAVDDRDLLLQLIAALPPRQRAVIALRYYEDLTDDEIAAALGCRPATVRSQASRAIATLRQAMPTALTPSSPGAR